ncbi:MAG: haloalkane dehalogenase [Proteobacteria bacterium]|nr:haloalkane dehalogenase [Pseudomonadota bacterium]
MENLRTPELCFRDLPGYPFEPNYLDDLNGFEGLRLHYLDEGPPDSEQVFLCLHGQPTWSYLYRKMIPHFVASGGRVVAPDLFGFGKSDKPAGEAFYTFSRHRDMLLAFVDRLDLQHITLVVQDWGGLLGLTLPVAGPRRYVRLIVMNTTLGTGDVELSKGFLQWRAYANTQPDLDVAKLMARSCPQLSASEAAAYGAPFPDIRYKAGVRRFPRLVPESVDDDGAAISRAARDWWGSAWNGSSFMAIGATDPVLWLPVMKHLRSLIRGCPEPFIHPTAGHFVQEWGDEIAAKALAEFARAKESSRHHRSGDKPKFPEFAAEVAFVAEANPSNAIIILK